MKYSIRMGERFRKKVLNDDYEIVPETRDRRVFNGMLMIVALDCETVGRERRVPHVSNGASRREGAACGGRRRHTVRQL